MTEDAILIELQKLGAMRLTEWLTRPQAHLVEFSKPLAERAGALLYPAIAGAFHDKANSIDVLIRSIDFAYLQDLAEGNYPYSVKLPAHQAITLVETLLQDAGAKRIDPYAAYDEALFAVKVKLRALKHMGPAGISVIQTTSDSIHEIARNFMASTDERYPAFPVLIWKDQIAALNRRLSAPKM